MANRLILRPDRKLLCRFLKSSNLRFEDRGGCEKRQKMRTIWCVIKIFSVPGGTSSEDPVQRNTPSYVGNFGNFGGLSSYGDKDKKAA